MMLYSSSHAPDQAIARKELIDTGFCTKTWCGVEYICITSTTKEYMAQPWEAEAYYLQEELFTEYENAA